MTKEGCHSEVRVEELMRGCVQEVHAIVRRKKTIMVRSNGESDMAFSSKWGTPQGSAKHFLPDVRLSRCRR